MYVRLHPSLHQEKRSRNPKELQSRNSSIAANAYNTLLLSRTQPEIGKIQSKNKYEFRKNPSTTSQILTI